MFKWFASLIGWVEHEFDDIVSEFHGAIAKLEALVERKDAQAAQAVEEIVRQNAIIATATADASKAAQVASNLRAIVSP